MHSLQIESVVPDVYDSETEEYTTVVNITRPPVDETLVLHTNKYIIFISDQDGE